MYGRGGVLYSTFGDGEYDGSGGNVTGSYAATIVAMMITPRAEMRWVEDPILEEDLIVICLFSTNAFTLVYFSCFGLCCKNYGHGFI